MDDRQRWWRGWKLLLLLVGGVLLLSGASGLRAQAKGPEMTVSTAWDGLVRKPGWVELQITLENESGDWAGEVMVKDLRWVVNYRLPVQLPAHAHKVYRLPVFLDGGSSVEVVLLDAEGVEAARHRVELHTHPFDARVCIAADPLTTMELGDCDEVLVLPQPAMMPEMASVWDTIDLLVMRDFPTAEMSEAQREALRAWVAAGGHLVLLEGPAMESMVKGLPPSLRPSCESTTLVPRSDGGMLSVCRRTVGKGMVDRPRQADPSALEVLWADDHVPATSWSFLEIGGRNPTASAFFPDITALFMTPRSAFPSPFLLPLFAFLYFLLLIPLPYLITRRLHRPMLTWLLMPAFILLALLGLSLWLSGFASDSFPITHEVCFVFVPDAEEPARMVSFGATLAPHQPRVRWSVEGFPRAGHGAFNMENPLWREEGAPYLMAAHLGQRETNVEVHAVRGIATWGWERLISAPALTMRGELTGKAYQLHVESEASLKLQALVLYDHYVLPLEGRTVEGGHEVEVSRPITAVRTYGYYSTEPSLCLDALLDRWLSTPMPVPPRREPWSWTVPEGHCFLLAEVPADRGELPVAQVEGSVAWEGCYIYFVPCPLGGIGTLISLPPGNIVLVEGDGWISQEGDVDVLSSSAGRESVWVITVPVFIPGDHLQRLQLTLRPRQEERWGEPTPAVETSPWETINRIFFWDWEAEEWVEMEKPVDGETLEVAPAEAFINTEREIRVRLEGDPSLPAMTIEVAVQFEGE